jgi:hypothetical protein
LIFFTVPAFKFEDARHRARIIKPKACASTRNFSRREWSARISSATPTHGFFKYLLILAAEDWKRIIRPDEDAKTRNHGFETARVFFQRIIGGIGRGAFCAT